MRKSVAAALITGSLLTGGAVGTALLGAGAATAQSSSDSSSSTDPTVPEQAPPGPGGRGPRGPHHRPHLDVAASTIGVTVEDLRAALEAGQSIADVATAHGVEPQAVIDAMVADARANLADKVADGDLTQEQADEIGANLLTRITELVNRDGLPAGRGGPGGDCPDKPAADGSTDDGTDSSSDSSSSSGTSFAA